MEPLEGSWRLLLFPSQRPSPQAEFSGGQGRRTRRYSHSPGQPGIPPDRLDAVSAPVPVPQRAGTLSQFPPPPGAAPPEVPGEDPGVLGRGS